MNAPSNRFANARKAEEQPAQDEPVPTALIGQAAAQMAGVDCFWNGVSALLSATRSGRQEEAFLVMTDAPPGKVVLLSRQALQDLAHPYGADILRITAGTSVSPDLEFAVLAVESAGRAGAALHAGAAGLKELMPATAARFGVRDRLEPAENIRGGVAYLDWHLNHFENDPILALAAYNAGEGAVENNSSVPL